MLVFHLYKKDKIKLFPYLAGLFVIMLFSSHFLFQNRTLDIALFLGTVIFVFILNFIENKPAPLGNVGFYHNMIHLSTSHENIQFNLNDPVKVKINYGGYKDKKMVGDVVPRYNSYSGIDNSLIIKIDHQTFEYNFMVENEYQETLLLELITSWKAQDFNIIYNQ